MSDSDSAADFGERLHPCSAWTHHSDGPTELCDNQATDLVWMFDGVCYWYCEEHATKATEWHDDARVMAP